MSIKLLPATLIGTLLSGTALADVPNVAVDIAPVHSLVARVMAGVGTPALVIPAGASPHEYSLRPSEAKALEDAGLVFWIGEDLTPWLEDAIETIAADADVVTLLEADGIELLEFREDASFEAHDHGDHEDHDDHDHEEHAADKDHDHDHDDHASEEHDHDHDDHAADEHDHDDHGHAAAEAKHDDHAHDDHGHEDHAEAHDDHDHDHDAHAGHDHGEHDPHAWLSPDIAATWLNVIAGQLSAADPDNAGTYFANAAAGREELEALKGEIAGILEPVQGKQFVAFHDAYQYFEAAFDFPAAGAISLSDASDPSPARIEEIQMRVREDGIDCVLSEPQYNPAMVATVMDGTEASTAVSDPLGSDLEVGAGMYPALLRNLATSIADCLK